MSQLYASARLYIKEFLKRKRSQRSQHSHASGNIVGALRSITSTNIIGVDRDASGLTQNLLASYESVIYDPSINSCNPFGSLIDHPLFLQSELQGCLDIGDVDYTCSFCEANFWLLERVEKYSTVNQPVFTLCCSKGKVQLSYLQRPPELLCNLIDGRDNKSLHFKKNIRSYNSMFAFTLNTFFCFEIWIGANFGDHPVY
ncbi:uncharacterized protein LOC110271505 [Arachis ipaensis]|uniref:uncharacterized protein LOC110271505 n=1 Tax=Arachis ipaensis TaxID=130454 RepID=UPI000A2B7E64|nr:uncharacterized protein LOC110271505 [Arachis ipaensis]